MEDVFDAFCCLVLWSKDFCSWLMFRVWEFWKEDNEMVKHPQPVVVVQLEFWTFQLHGWNFQGNTCDSGQIKLRPKSNPPTPPTIPWSTPHSTLQFGRRHKFYPGKSAPRTCRICLESEISEGDQLLAPCLCRGSSKLEPWGFASIESVKHRWKHCKLQLQLFLLA